MKEVFISFSSKETEEAFRICRLIEDGGFTCFIAPRDLLPGEEYAAQLIENIADAKVVVLLLSEASNKSPHVLREVEYAVSKRIPILVYPLEQVELTKSLEYYLMTHQWIPTGVDRDVLLLRGVENGVKGVKRTRESVGRPAEVGGKASGGIGKILLPICLLCVILAAIIFIVRFAAKDDRPIQASGSETGMSSDVVGETKYTVGDTISFGTYENAPIEWRVIQVHEDGTLYLLSKDILSFKPYDAAESGTYNEYQGVDYWSYANYDIEDKNLQVMVRGNANWSESNLRTWLNAKSEVVTYADQAPTHQALGKNFYNTEPGFLHGFSEEERTAIVPVTHTSKVNAVTGTAETTDAVWLLSEGELNLLKTAEISIYAAPTEECLGQAENRSLYEHTSREMGVTGYYWWLRDASPEKANIALAVGTEMDEDSIIPSSVGVCSYGVRPAICIDPAKCN